MITISAFSQVPDFAKGLVRDVRVRWALEEAGLSYNVRLLEQGDQDKPDYHLLQPFGQVPIFVLHIGERSEALLPKNPAARARAVQWLFAALNSVEPSVVNLFLIDVPYADQEWAKLRRPGAVEFMNKKLDAVAKRLGDKPFLDGERFTAGDLMMATVLRFHSEVAKRNPRLAAYIDRCTARPAFKRALQAHLSDFRQAA
jgi:glutathione S-transferase